MTSGRRSRTRGQALTEFALVFPLLMVLLIAIFDVGRLVFAYNDITNAARSAARVAIVNQSVADIKQAAVSQATGIALDTSDVTVNFVGPTCAPIDFGCSAEVEVQFKWTAITPIIGNIIGPITVRTETRMPIERIFP